MDSAKFGNEAHFMSFAAIIATKNGTEGSNFHIRNTMTAIVEVSGNRLVCIVACDRAKVLAKPSPQTSSSLRTRFGEHRRSVHPLGINERFSYI